jgi:hypothetical protein
MTASPYGRILLQAGSRHTPTVWQLAPFFLHKAKEVGPASILAPTSMAPNHYENDHLS